MRRVELQQKDIYALRGRFLTQRTCKALAVGACVGWDWRLCDWPRWLYLPLSVYRVRMLLTEFVFLKRAAGRSEGRRRSASVRGRIVDELLCRICAVSFEALP